jgi:1,4-dihydroxy-6-naphthoate synthase
MKLTLGFSPCPNDTFIFDAMVHNRIDTEGLSFDVIMEDVEALNHRAFQKELHVTKLSYHAFAHLVENYALLESGSALGNGVGPLLITKNETVKNAVNESLIAIPGKYTTANFLFSLAYPESKKKKEMVFHEIEGAILRGDVDAGVIIHENRFTYQEKNLKKIIDLGEFWESTTNMPIPLGGIVVRRDLSQVVQEKIERVMQRSVQYALKNPWASREYVVANAQEMDETVMQRHIDLYVNRFTEALGQQGRAAVNALFQLSLDKKLIPNYTSKIYVT